MSYCLSDADLTTPSGPMDSDEDVSNIMDQFTRSREFEKRYRHPDVEIIYSFEDVPRKNLEKYYLQLLDEAMERRCPKIVVEPSSLGIRLGQYINMGYYMHWLCIGSGLTAIFFGFTFRHKTYLINSCAILSCLLLHASNLYYKKLRIAHYNYADHAEIQEYVRNLNPDVKLLSDFPTVLVPYNPFKRRLWHHVIGISAGIMMASLTIRGLPELLCRCADGVIPQVIRYEGNLFEFFAVFPIFTFASNSNNNVSIYSAYENFNSLSWLLFSKIAPCFR